MKDKPIVIDSMTLQPWAPGTVTSGPIVSDPFGAYTGRPKDPKERPVQDADDL